MSSKFLLEISYNGSDFSGWQRQPNGLSVQEALESKLSYLYDSPINLRGAGRTDAGVHAVGMTAVFMPPLKPHIEHNKLKTALNKILPKSIFIRNVRSVKPEFDPRFDAVGKAYTYIISQKMTGPFMSDFCWHTPFMVDTKKVIAASEYLIGEHDFSSFAVKQTKNRKNPIRHIFKIDTQLFEGFICITFIGKSFLYKMVRSLVGSLVFLSGSKGKPEDMKKILESRDRSKAFKTAPPHGLFLVKVFYDKETCQSFKLDRLPIFKTLDYL